jgi:hypothetical protein
MKKTDAELCEQFIYGESDDAKDLVSRYMAALNKVRQLEIHLDDASRRNEFLEETVKDMSAYILKLSGVEIDGIL